MAVGSSRDTFGFFARIAAQELADAIDQVGLEYAEILMLPYAEAVLGKVRQMVAARRLEACKQGHDGEPATFSRN